MSKLYGDNVELTDEDARIVKGMIERGDKNQVIAAFFGVNQRAISNIRSKKKFEHVAAAKRTELPPPGPYRVDLNYIRFYQTITKVDELWNNMELKKAKILLEKALRDPVFLEDPSHRGNLSADAQEVCEILEEDFFRNDYGLYKKS